MPKLRYRLEPGGPKRLELSYRLGWKDMVITLDGNRVGEIPTKDELFEGQTFRLHDGSELKVQLDREKFGLYLYLDGKPVMGSFADPAKSRWPKILSAVAVVLVIILVVLRMITRCSDLS